MSASLAEEPQTCQVNASRDPMVLTPYDTRTFQRSAAFGLLLCALAFVVMWATDGATTTLGGKLARLGVMAPVLGAIGCAMAGIQGRLRGEQVALQAIGASHARILAGSLAASACIGALGAAALASRAADLSALFPALRGPSWLLDPDGSWRSAADGVVVRSGAPAFSFVDSIAAAENAAPSRLPVVLAAFASTAALAWWMARPMRVASRALVGALAVLATIVAFHLSAAGRLGTWILVAGPVLLGAHAALDAILSHKSPVLEGTSAN